uniref:Uncharacterized protein n=1 Tax=Anopheles atroparvus TaxID=41427 RepID=A0A182JGB8_ANOAO
MERWYRMLLILLAFGIAASRQDDSLVGEESETFDVEKQLDETVVTTATERSEAATSSDSDEVTTSDEEELTERGGGRTHDNPEVHLTTVFEADRDEVEEETIAVQAREEELPATTTTVASTTLTTLPSGRSHGRMVRFGNSRRTSRPTTAEPPRRSTANSRALLNRRGLFNPELRNRYLARFRSTTPEPKS